MVALNENTVELSKDSRRMTSTPFKRSICGCSARTGTLLIGWFHFIVCFIPFVLLIAIAIYGRIEFQEYIEKVKSDNFPSFATSTEAEQSTTWNYSEENDRTTTNSYEADVNNVEKTIEPKYESAWKNDFDRDDDLVYPQLRTENPLYRRQVGDETIDSDLAAIDDIIAGIDKTFFQIQKELNKLNATAQSESVSDEHIVNEEENFELKNFESATQIMDYDGETTEISKDDTGLFTEKSENNFDSPTNKGVIDTLPSSTEKSTVDFEYLFKDEAENSGDSSLMKMLDDEYDYEIMNKNHERFSQSNDEFNDKYKKLLLESGNKDEFLDKLVELLLESGATQAELERCGLHLPTSKKLDNSFETTTNKDLSREKLSSNVDLESNNHELSTRKVKEDYFPDEFLSFTDETTIESTTTEKSTDDIVASSEKVETSKYSSLDNGYGGIMTKDQMLSLIREINEEMAREDVGIYIEPSLLEKFEINFETSTNRDSNNVDGMSYSASDIESESGNQESSTRKVMANDGYSSDEPRLSLTDSSTDELTEESTEELTDEKLSIADGNISSASDLESKSSTTDKLTVESTEELTDENLSIGNGRIPPTDDTDPESTRVLEKKKVMKVSFSDKIRPLTVQWTDLSVTDNYETSTNGFINEYESSTNGIAADGTESSSVKPPNDDETSLVAIDVALGMEYMIYGILSAIQQAETFYLLALGTMFGIGANFHAILLIGAHSDYTTPIQIWLIEQSVLLLINLSLLVATAFYLTNVHLLIVLSSTFCFSLYCILIVRSHLSNLNYSKKLKLKLIEAV